ncbi:MAG TPA: hypothetical protein VLI06_05295 [Solimonas sp.]|nr:hypothetical protein [Solimonas sp.]
MSDERFEQLLQSSAASIAAIIAATLVEATLQAGGYPAELLELAEQM